MPIQDREARNAYMRAYYAAHPQKQIDRVAKRNAQVIEQNREVISEAKSRPCADCSQSYPTYVMDFDHVRGEKLFNIGDHSKRHVSPKLLAAEMAKCEVVCASCHRIRTHERLSE